ncbi:hypothetical protein TRIUR3_10187 [Triticum urartu]|uniref:Uncharacterized protein n=1 Tax=Triticum urartu TaxID=4572 RepID=M7Z4E8_TRIUA|nr:hypothetical protein TRIUR3_10187 [Triticum urartu]
MALSSLLPEPALKSMGDGLGNHGSYVSYHSSSNVNKTPFSSICLPANRRHTSLPQQLLSMPALEAVSLSLSTETKHSRILSLCIYLGESLVDGFDKDIQ